MSVPLEREDVAAGFLAPGRLVLAGAALAALIAVLYRSVIPWWVADLWQDPNYSHGLLVPFVSAWLVYQRRHDLARLRPRPAVSAGLLAGVGLVLLVAGLLAAELFVTRLSMLVLVTGLIAFVLGYEYVRVVALPLAFLLFMVPLPALVFNAIALPLQLLASQIAVGVLQWVGVPALREGNIILLPNATLEVVEACSGLRSLVSLGAISVIIAVVWLRRPLLRLIVMLSSIPVAVLTNGARISGTGLLAYHYGSQVADGFFHVFSGWVVFVTALAFLGSEAVLLRRVDAP